MPRVWGRRRKLIIHNGHHKIGTTLFTRVLEILGSLYRLEMAIIWGTGPPPWERQLVLSGHSQVELASAPRPYVGTHVIRDPRDVIVSGYRYHKWCNEPWVDRKPDPDTPGPILRPRVPAELDIRTEEWKREYLRSLRGKSYQQHLNELDDEDGLMFELEHYGRWTTEAMLAWDYDDPRVLEVRFEEIQSDFDGTFRRILRHYGFSRRRTEEGVAAVRGEDVARMSPVALASRPKIQSRGRSVWRDFFTDRHEARFRELFPDALQRLGYENSDAW